MSTHLDTPHADSSLLNTTLPDVTLTRPDGSTVPLSAVLGPQRTLLVFVRHLA